MCSVRPFLNDRFRLGAAGQIIELRQAENDPLQSFIYACLDATFRIVTRSQGHSWFLVRKSLGEFVAWAIF